jgi:hypothetical protein
MKTLFSFLICPIAMFSQENLTIDLPSVLVPAEFCGTWRSPSTTTILTFKCNDEFLEISNYDTLDGKVYLEEVLFFDKEQNIIRTHLFVEETKHDLIVEYYASEDTLRSTMQGSFNGVINYYKEL